MPTERFDHLPDEKKRAILEAAIDEFIRMPFEKASINKIIQSAGISRGSFYTYFEDKRDVIGYIFSDSTEKLKAVWEELLRKNKGDLWWSTELLMDYTMLHARRGRLFQLMRNIALFQDLDKIFGRARGMRVKESEFGNMLLTDLYEVTDKSGLKKADMDYFKKLMSMILIIFMEAMGCYYHHPEDSENIKKVFREKLEILRYGICKQ